MNNNCYENSTIEVLLSTMNQEDWSFLSKMNIQTDAVIVNQADKQDYIDSTYNGNRIVFISSLDRGLSKSRNLACSRFSDCSI